MRGFTALCSDLLSYRDYPLNVLEGNRSTKVIEGSRALAGIGRHTMAVMLNSKTTNSISHMGAEGTGAPFWFQLYMLRDRGVVRELLARAKVAQCSALVFTIDLARVGIRYSDIRRGLTTKATPRSTAARMWDVLSHRHWLADVSIKGGPLVFGNLAEYVPKARKIEDFKAWVDEQFDPSVTWKDIEWRRTQWDGPILLKGILEPDDAAMAASIGVQGIVVSNHGGRQLDGAVGTARALPAIAEKVAGRLAVLVDGDIRYGHDIAKARALGADAVMIGRAWAWSMAAAGQAGVAQALGNLDIELRHTLGLMGLARMADVNRSHLWQEKGP